MGSTIAPRGLIVDLVTPLHPDGAVDGPGWKTLLDRVAPRAQAVLLAGPHAGEGRHLTLGQKTELLDGAMVAVDGNVPLLVWVTHDTTIGTVETIQILQACVTRRKYAGAVFWIDTPLYHHSNRGLPAHFQELSTFLSHPVILYNDPALVGSLGRSLKRSNLRTAVLKELTSLEALAGLIFLGPLDRFHNYQKACRFRKSFRLYDGDEGMFLDHPSSGGVVSAGANLAPRAWQRVVRAALHEEADQQEYPDHQQQIWKWGGFLYRLKSTYEGHPSGTIKEVLWKTGILESPTCVVPPPDLQEAADRAAALLHRYGEYP